MTFEEEVRELGKIFGFVSGTKSKKNEWALDTGPYTIRQFEEAANLLGVGLEKLSVKSRGFTGGCGCCDEGDPESEIMLCVER